MWESFSNESKRNIARFYCFWDSDKWRTYCMNVSKAVKWKGIFLYRIYFYYWFGEYLVGFCCFEIFKDNGWKCFSINTIFYWNNFISVKCYGSRKDSNCIFLYLWLSKIIHNLQHTWIKYRINDMSRTQMYKKRSWHAFIGNQMCSA